VVKSELFQLLKNVCPILLQTEEKFDLVRQQWRSARIPYRIQQAFLFLNLTASNGFSGAIQRSRAAKVQLTCAGDFE
jgi:hypothetical protein